MMETWHPLGVTGIISAFNFPVAVWSWNALSHLSAAIDDLETVEKTPLTAIATQAIFEKAVKRYNAQGGKAPPISRRC